MERLGLEDRPLEVASGLETFFCVLLGVGVVSAPLLIAPARTV